MRHNYLLRYVHTSWYNFSRNRNNGFKYLHDLWSILSSPLYYTPKGLPIHTEKSPRKIASGLLSQSRSQTKLESSTCTHILIFWLVNMTCCTYLIQLNGVNYIHGITMLCKSTFALQSLQEALKLHQHLTAQHSWDSQNKNSSFILCLLLISNY